MTSKSKPEINCAMCNVRVCMVSDSTKSSKNRNCTSKTQKNVIKSVKELYGSSENKDFARISSVVEGLSYVRVPWSDAPSPITSRLEEIIRFASMMGYKKLGVVFCIGLANEAEVLVPLLENAGFEVVSVCCKTGSIPKEEIGVEDTQKVVPGKYEAMCNPIAQAEIMNKAKCDFNIMMGLCVGHDSLFLKYSKAPVTVFAVKDRLLGHNPLMALYLSGSYYRRLRSPELGKKLSNEKVYSKPIVKQKK